MKNVYTFILVITCMVFGQAQNYQYGIVQVSGNNFKVVAIPDFNSADSNTNTGQVDVSDVGFTLMLPADPSEIQNVTSMLSGRTWNLNAYDAAFLTGQGLGDGTKDAFLITMNPGQSIINHATNDQIDLVSFDIVNPPTSGDLYFLENSDPIAQGASGVLDSWFNVDIDGPGTGNGTGDYYNGNNPSMDSFSFGTTSDFVVNTTDDTDDINTTDGICEDTNGNCSLRAALQQAAANSDTNTIGFNIAGAGPHTITLAGATYNPIFNPVLIDATTQAGYTQGNPQIVLNGNGLDFGFAFLTNSSASEIKGMSLVNFNIYAIHAQNTGNHNFEDNFVGINPDGETANANFTGIRLENSSGNTVNNNVISGNTAVGLLLDTGSQNNVVTGNLIGTNSSGTLAVPNADNVVISNSPNNTIGGINPQERNIISGALDTNSEGEGININGSTSTGNLITGNYIGTDISCANSLQNAFAGVLIHVEANANTVSNNVISGNFDENFNDRSGIGIQISGVGTDNNIIQDNKIGTDVNGSVALENRSGIDLQLGPSGTQILNNTISGNRNSGIEIGNPQPGAYVVQTVIFGNRIGLTHDGETALPNLVGITSSGAGSSTIGSNQISQRNYISGNTLDGIRIFDTSDMEVYGNYIGLNVVGSAVGNGQNGIWLDGFSTDFNNIGSTNSGEGNVISGNSERGVLISNDAGLNLVVGNFIGTNASGTAAIGNDIGVEINNALLNLVSNNVISGNTDVAVNIVGSGASENEIKSNYIGTDVNGVSAIPNFYGIEITNSNLNIIGGSNAGEGNIISAQTGDAIRLSNADNNEIKQNLIGLQADGTSALGNGNNGILIFNGSANNTVGGLGTNDANTIAYNSKGITITPGPPGFPAPLNNRVSQNSILNNTTIGIDLGTIGITNNDASDADAGSNNLQNFPVLTNNAEINGSDITLTYSVDSAPTNSAYPLTVEFFIDDTNRQGKEFLFADTYTETDFNSGNKTITLALPVGSTFMAGQEILASATDANGNTSEFSIAVMVEDATLTIEDNELSTISVYPNPVSDILFISSETTIYQIELYSILGKKIFETNETNQLNVSKYSNGMYLLKIKTTKGEKTFKVVIKK